MLTATSERLGKSFVMDVTDNFPVLRGRLTLRPPRATEHVHGRLQLRRQDERAQASSSSIVKPVCAR